MGAGRPEIELSYGARLSIKRGLAGPMRCHRLHTVKVSF